METQTKRNLLYFFILFLLAFGLYSCQTEQKIEHVNPVGPGNSNPITIISPNGGEIISAGSSFEIKWTGDGIGTVTIEYSLDNGANWVAIISDYPNSGSFLWDPVPDHITENCIIRIKDSENNSSDQSDAPFKIVPQAAKSLNITKPNGGEQLFVDQSYEISWVSTAVEFVKIEFSSDNGSSWITVAGSYPADSSSYLWSPVPNFPSNECLVRLTDVDADTITSTSGTTFSISASRTLSVTEPNGGESWSAGSTQTITWNSDHINNVKIEYSTDNGDSWMLITASTPSDGSYTWDPVPNTPTTLARIRITDADNDAPSDISDGNFQITGEQDLAIVSPNGGEIWPVGSSQIISWTSASNQSPVKGGGSKLNFSLKSEFVGSKIKSPNNIMDGITNVKLEYSTDAGATWNTIVEATANTGSYVWEELPDINSSLCRVRISDAADGLPNDISDDNFTISNSSAEEITVTSPNGEENWEAGTSHNITWHSTSVSNVKIEYTINNGVEWFTIVNSTPSDGFYTWDPIPNTPSTNCRIRISDATDGFPEDLSDDFFSIVPEAGITVLSPNGGETIQTGTSENITWSSVNIANVKIEFTTNGGASWDLIVNSTPSDGHYIWDPVPDVNSSLCKIRISDAADGLPSDVSDDNFTITDQNIQTIEVISPNGGEEWLSGTSQNITWNASGIPSVDIEYSTDNGLTWTVITTGAAGSGSYEWNPIPDINSTQCKVRVKDSADGSPADESNGVFVIHPVQILNVTTPNGGEVYVAGDPVEITWESQGVENVSIEYTVNNGILPEDWFTLVESTPSDGHYTTGFSIPSEQYRIRIKDASDGSPMDECDGTFTVLAQPQITVTSPNGGEHWLVGQTYEIDWQSNNVENVKIEYTTNGGFSWNTIIESTPSDGIFEQWAPTMQDTSSNCLIRISDAVDNSPSDVSDNFFSIHGGPQLSVVYPNGGEYINSDCTIIWTSTAISNVGIDYTLDNGVTWVNITPNTQSTGAYLWHIPSNTSSLARVRIYDASNPTFQDQSDSYFFLNVTPGFRFLNMNENETLKAGGSKEIKWIESSDVSDVILEYSLDNGRSWKIIQQNLATRPNDENSFIWRNIPNKLSDNTLLRIRDAAGKYSAISEKFRITR